jgi:drug/metabolite transporter (DMT)-like permease
MLLSPGAHAAKQMNLKTKINPLLLAIPAACDVIGSTLMNIALTQTAASIYQMIRGIIVLITAAMAMMFLKKKQYRY